MNVIPKRFISWWVNIALKSIKQSILACFKRKGTISTRDVDQFLFLGSNILSTESDTNIRLAKILTAMNKLSIIW